MEFPHEEEPEAVPMDSQPYLWGSVMLVILDPFSVRLGTQPLVRSAKKEISAISYDFIISIF